MTHFAIALATSALALGLNACDKQPTAQAPANTDTNAPIQVVATTGMVADLVRAIGGEHVKVNNLIGEGIDPHLYKPTRDDVAALLAAEMVFYNGLQLEGKLGAVLESAAQERPVVAVASSVPKDLLLHPARAEGHPDPHIWLDASIWSQCGDSVVAALIEQRPDDAAAFRTNLEAFQTDAASIHDYGTRAMATIDPEVRLLITSHDAFNYFGRAYGIEVVGIQGVTTESEAGLADVEALVTMIVERNVPAVFVESSVPTRSVQALVEGARARGANVVIGGELFSDAMGTTGTYEGTWSGMVDHNLTVVARALGGEAPISGRLGKLNAPAEHNEKAEHIASGTTGATP